jgi:hypothetical protein
MSSRRHLSTAAVIPLFIAIFVMIPPNSSISSVHAQSATISSSPPISGSRISGSSPPISGISPTTSSTSPPSSSSNANPSPNPNAYRACSNQPEQKQGNIPPFCARLIVIKNVEPTIANSGPSPSQFNIHVTGNNPSQSSFAGSSSGTLVIIAPGHYSVEETGDIFGYTPSYSPGCSGIISGGQSQTCIITNTEILNPP